LAVAILAILALVALIVGPSMWVKRVIARNAHPRADFPGTGGEFARHVLDGMGLKSVKVEETPNGDHYDPEAKAVRLLPQHFGGKSLAAVVIAAHEVGHAMQDATGYAPLRHRTRLARQAHWVTMAGNVVIVTAPLVMAVTKLPQILALQLVGGIAIIGITVLMHAVTLPVEFDASFGRALPLLKAGRYIPDADMPEARRLLKASACTYVAAAALSMLNVARWLRWFRI
jgi:Zn-dependent membrane protease YugP